MNKLLVLPLILLSFSALMTQLMASEESIYTTNGTDSYSFDSFNTTIDGADTEYEIDAFSVNAQFTLQDGVLALIIITVALGFVVGFQVVGSGPNTQATRIFYTSLFFYSLWGLLTVFGLPSITIVPVFGWVFYFFLTLLYSVGIVGQINGTE